VLIDERERLETLCGAERLYEAQQSLQEALAQNEAWNLFGQENNGFLFILVTVKFCLLFCNSPTVLQRKSSAFAGSSQVPRYNWRGTGWGNNLEHSDTKEQLRRDLDLARLREQQSHADAADADATEHRKRCEGLYQKEKATRALVAVAFGRKPPFFHRLRVDSYHHVQANESMLSCGPVRRQS